MRTAITIGVEHKTGKTSLIYGPELPEVDQVKEIKKLPQRSSHDKFSRIEIWESSAGVIKSLKFSTPEDDLKQKEIRRAQEAEHKANLERIAAKDSGESEAKPDHKPKAKESSKK